MGSRIRFLFIRAKIIYFLDILFFIFGEEKAIARDVFLVLVVLNKLSGNNLFLISAKAKKKAEWRKQRTFFSTHLPYHFQSFNIPALIKMCQAEIWAHPPKGSNNPTPLQKKTKPDTSIRKTLLILLRFILIKS